MKTIYQLTAGLLLAASPAFGQATTYHVQLDSNDCSAIINSNGILFHDISNHLGGYLVPKDSNVISIYTMDLMAFGLDANNNIRGAVAGPFNTDFTSGPIANDYNDPSYVSRYGIGLWKVSKAQIDYHITHWNTQGYTPDPVILDWPGNGNMMNGEEHFLAPFADLNANALYEPVLGEYPLIRGDQAVYSILNDDAYIHTSGTMPMGIEIHLMVYQYASPDSVLNHTTFIHSTVFNRSATTYYDFRFGGLIDFDLGNYADDYMGTNTDLQMTYVYNADLNDEYHSGQPGFMEYPPALGLMVLNRPLESNMITPMIGQNPTQPNELYYVLHGLTTSGAPYLHDGQPTPYIYTDTISDSTGWNESVEINPGGDRRSYYSVTDNDGTLQPGEMLCTDFALAYGRSYAGTLFASTGAMFDAAQAIRTFYDNQAFACNEPSLNTTELSAVRITVYPNPANDRIRIDGVNSGSFRIVAADGKIVSEGMLSSEGIDIDFLPQGHYQISVSSEAGMSTAAFIK